MAIASLTSTRRKAFIAAATVIALALTGFAWWRLNKETDMRPPLVYLIPEDYFGPVFAFFNQKDGVELQPDPLGRAVWVPENGVIKIREDVLDAVGRNSETTRAELMVLVSKDGQRRILGEFSPTAYRSEEDDRLSWVGYIDPSMRVSKFTYNRQTRKGTEYIPAEIRDVRAVWGHESCIHQGFTDRMHMRGDMEISDENYWQQCVKFMVATPNEWHDPRLPNWMWEDAQRYFKSIQAFEKEANERVKLKKEHYKTP